MSAASSVPKSALDAATSFCLVCSGVVRETWAWSLALSPQPSTSQFAVPFFTSLTEFILKKSLVKITARSGQIMDGETNSGGGPIAFEGERDRKSTRLNSSHQIISYAVFCLK